MTELSRTSTPPDEASDEAGGVARDTGPVIVVTAISLKPAAREALAHRLGPGHVVRDIRQAGNTADVVLVPAVSATLVGSLRAMFPGAKILVAELTDAELDLNLRGPVARTMATGIDGYFVAPSLEQLATATREVAQGRTPAALTGGSGGGAVRALESAGRGDPVRIDVPGWATLLYGDTPTADQLRRCAELARLLADDLTRRGLEVKIIDSADSR